MCCPGFSSRRHVSNHGVVFSGVAYPNILKWVPDHVPPSGLTFIHLSGNGTVRMGNHLIDVRGHEFVHDGASRVGI